MILTKPWYMSRTIWASIVAIFAGTARAVGLPLDELDSARAADSILEAISAVSALVAIYGRFVATDRIG
jgi:hypothetical protein